MSRATGSATTPSSSRSPTRRTASSSSTCARATSRSTSARAPSTSASPAATCCATPARRPTRCCRSASAGAGSGSPAPRGASPTSTELAGKRIATSYVGVVSAFLEERGIEAEVVRLDGAVETSIQLGVADAIADVVETGSTLRQAGLEVFGETILESEAVLITRAGDVPPGFEIFRRRVEGVLVARTYVMMDYDIDRGARRRAVELTPGIEGPTISPLHREGWVAVRAMVPRDRRPAADGRALRDGCARDPAHGHPCLPTLTPGRCPPCRAPGGRSGPRVVGIAVTLALVVVCRGRRGSPSTPRPGPGSRCSSAAPWSSSG